MFNHFEKRYTSVTDGQTDKRHSVCRAFIAPRLRHSDAIVQIHVLHISLVV